LSSQTNHKLKRHSDSGELKSATPTKVGSTSASFLDRVHARVQQKNVAAQPKPSGKHASMSARHRHHPPVGLHTPYAAAVIDVRGVLEANPWMDIAVVVAVAQSMTHLMTQNDAVNKLMRHRFVKESKKLAENNRAYDMDYCGSYFGGCGAWYVGMGSLWYMNTSHHGFGNVASPSPVDGNMGFEGVGACDMVSGCGGDWVGNLGGTELGIAMNGEFEIDLDGMDLDIGGMDGFGDNFDLSGILDGLIS